jgi:hypothetical protein
MPPAGFETTIPASERPQIHALDRTATGISHETNIINFQLRIECGFLFCIKAQIYTGMTLAIHTCSASRLRHSQEQARHSGRHMKSFTNFHAHMNGTYSQTTIQRHCLFAVICGAISRVALNPNTAKYGISAHRLTWALSEGDAISGLD